MFDRTINRRPHTVFFVHAVQKLGIDMRTVFFMRFNRNIAAGQNLNNRQIERFGKIIVALVMRRHRHNRTGSVSHQNIVGNKDRYQLTVIRILRLNPFQFHPGFALVHRALQIRLGCRFFNIGLNFRRILKAACQLGDIRMLRSQNHIGHAKSGIRTGRKYGQFFTGQFGAVAVGQSEIELCPFRTSDPVNLLRFNPVNKIQVLQIVNQTVGIFGNRHHPLLFVLAYNLRSATLATAVDNFFVCQPYFAARTPVNGHFVFIGQTLFKQFDKHPLRPFVIFRITGGNATVPVKTETDRLHLFGKIGDVRRR